MYKTYLRHHHENRLHSVSRKLTGEEAIEEYRRLLARDDLIGEPWAAVLRMEFPRRTLLFSRFDKEKQRLIPSDPIDLEALTRNTDNQDQRTRALVAARVSAG